MFKKIEVSTNVNGFEMNEKSKNIIGEIYFKIEDEYFPQKEWSDFVVVILSWWIEAVSTILKSKINTSCKLFFMDGPYVVNGMKIDDEIVNLEFVRSDKVLFETQCNIGQLKESLLTTSQTVLKKVEEKKWDTNDVRKLKSSINLLK
jgi:hypothetical protein